MKTPSSSTVNWSCRCLAGLRRTQADKRRAVERLLKDTDWSRWSDRKIAEVAKVDHKTVGTIRRELRGEFPTPAPRRTVANSLPRTTASQTVMAARFSARFFELFPMTH